MLRIFFMDFSNLNNSANKKKNDLLRINCIASQKLYFSINSNFMKKIHASNHECAHKYEKY